MASNERLLDLEKERAKFAFDCAREGKEIIDGIKIDENYYKDKNYLSYVKKIPMMVKVNGLGPTYAFMYSKGKIDVTNKKELNAYALIYNQTDKWLIRSSLISYKSEEKSLIETIISWPSSKYRVVSIEVISFLNWVRRFAEGMIGDNNEG